MILEANSSYIVEKLDALNGAIESIRSQHDDSDFSSSMRALLVGRLERERDRLNAILPMMSTSV